MPRANTKVSHSLAKNVSLVSVSETCSQDLFGRYFPWFPCDSQGYSLQREANRPCRARVSCQQRTVVEQCRDGQPRREASGVSSRWPRWIPRSFHGPFFKLAVSGKDFRECGEELFYLFLECGYKENQGREPICFPTSVKIRKGKLPYCEPTSPCLRIHLAL